MDLPMGYICELGDEECKTNIEAGPLLSNDYKIVIPDAPETVGFDRARKACQEFGQDWDLIIFNHKSEFDFVQSLIGRFINHTT